MAAYVMLQEGKWVNTAEWDGVSDWLIPDDITLIPFEDGVFGWDGKWTYDGIDYDQPQYR